MWTSIGFIVYLSGLSPITDNAYESHQIGIYSSEKECIKSGQEWVKKHHKINSNADFTCEKQPLIDKND